MQAQPSHVGTFGLGASDTLMHPVVATAMVAAILCMVGLPRRFKVVPFLLALFLLPVGQQLYFGGVHFYVPRILVLVGLGILLPAKLRSKTSILPGGWNELDTIFTCWAVFRALAQILFYWGDTSSLIFQVAFLWDTLGGYFIFRFLIRNTADIRRVARTFAIIAGILGCTLLWEHSRGLNVWGYLGSVPLVSSTRDGTIRAQGPFEHAILAGSFAATLLPFFIWLLWRRKSRLLGGIGIAGSTAMVFSCNASTPLTSYVAAIIGICFWPLRGKMRTIRWTFVVLLVLCQLSMKVPVWFLIARVQFTAGNSGYHRAELIDSLIRHFSDWWLIGTNKQATWGFEMDDICEQWVAEGGCGGVATLVCFILLIARSFSRIGTARRRVAKDRKQEWLLWLIGVALFSHCVGFFGISYFDQTRFAWYALFCVISAATIRKRSMVKRPKRLREQPQRISDDEEIAEVLALAPIAVQHLRADGSPAS